MKIINNDFKTIQLVSYHSAIDNKKDRAYRYLLSRLIVAQTNKYQTKLAMSVRLEALYGALLSAKTELNGNINTIGVSLMIADPKTVGDDQLFDDAVAFFKSVIYDHDSFDQDIFEDEKRILIEQWETLKDHKAAYASYKFNEIFRLPDLTGYPMTGTLSDVRKTTAKGLYAYYRDVFLNDDMLVVINGHIVDESKLSALNHMSISKHLLFETTFRKPRALSSTYEETEMNQAIIKLGYTFPIYRFDDDYPEAMLTNVIIGGYPESRLFKIIREQEALCYDVSSSYDTYKGTLAVSAGVAIDREDDAKRAMIDLINQTIAEGITEDELQMAKGYVSHQLKASMDHQSFFTKRAYYMYLTSFDESVESRIRRIQKITVEGVSLAMKRLYLDTVFVLKGKQS